jgi:S1-C subfamily serine protease
MLGVEVQSTSQTGLGGGFGSGNQSGSDVAGVTIADVVSGSPADNAGMSAGDVITSVGSTSVTSPDALSAALSGYHPGNRVQIQWVDQSGQQQSATVTLASGPPQ